MMAYDRAYDVHKPIRYFPLMIRIRQADNNVDTLKELIENNYENSRNTFFANNITSPTTIL
jgi:hypothetical protein